MYRYRGNLRGTCGTGLPEEICPFSRMAYNKSKNVEVAQKLLNQGKVAQAIAEYQNILKFEPRDQVTLMTIGELYIRQGETFRKPSGC